MELQDKIELNKKIRAYKGTNNFVLSLQKQLKTNKYLNKVEWKGKMVKVLSEKQYEAALNSLDQSIFLKANVTESIHQLASNGKYSTDLQYL